MTDHDEGLISSSLNIMRRMPPKPKSIQNDVFGLLTLLPGYTDDILQRIDQPLSEAIDPVNGRKYLTCDYNRDGDSYRSPFSNAYDPPLEDGFTPSDALRDVEILANELFDSYRELYYLGSDSISSVYLWDLGLDINDNETPRAPTTAAFAGCFLIKKNITRQRHVQAGVWNSIHIIEVLDSSFDSRPDQATYKLTSTVMFSIDIENQDTLGQVAFCGNFTRQVEKKLKLELSSGSSSSMAIQEQHVCNMGRMIEDMENEMRSNIDRLYIAKTREIISSIRQKQDDGNPLHSMVKELVTR